MSLTKDDMDRAIREAMHKAGWCDDYVAGRIDHVCYIAGMRAAADKVEVDAAADMTIRVVRIIRSLRAAADELEKQ